MSWKKFKYIYIAFFSFFVLSGIITFYWASDNEPLQKPETLDGTNLAIDDLTIGKDIDIVFQKEYRLCKELNLNCKPEVDDSLKVDSKELNNLTWNKLKKMYPEEKLFRISKDDNKIIVTKLVDGLCPIHKKIYHLGLDKSLNYVAVYYGPSEVRNLAGVYKVTDIPIKSLPLEYQEKIENYSSEFYSEDELVAILDSLTEFLD